MDNNKSDYDGVFLSPLSVSFVNSRTEPDLHSEYFNGAYPIFSSPMKGISGSNLVIEMGRNNCIGILHRFDAQEKRIEKIHNIANSEVKYGVAIGVNNWEIELDIASCAFEHEASIIVVDVANGYMSKLKDIGKSLRNRFGDEIDLMCGNVVSYAGAEFLYNDCGFNWVRCGIGNGSLCETRSVTAIGRNQLNALADCRLTDANIVSDGGIRNTSDIVKSFAFGADFVMLGRMLSYANEAENDGLVYGMASMRNHIENNKDIKSVEGKEEVINISEKRPLKDIIDEILWGIKSSCTYLNCDSYAQIPFNCLIEKSEYIPER